MRVYVSHAWRVPVALPALGVSARNAFHGGLEKGDVPISLHRLGAVPGGLQRV